MKNRKRVNLPCICGAALVILASLLANSLFAQNNPTQAKPTPRFARLARMEGTAQLLRDGEKDWEDATLNILIAEGDQIKTDDNSYLDVQFDNGMNLKIDGNTVVEFTDLGKDESSNEKTSIYVTSGVARITVPRYYSAEKRFYVETPDCFASFAEESKGEIEVASAQSKVTAYTGRAEVSGDKGQVSLLAGEYTLVSKDSAPFSPEQAGAPGGSFNQWCSAQEQGEQTVANSQYAPYIDNSGELDSYGRWVNVASYGWCWRPRVHFGWRPYLDGHWSYAASFGWVWTSDEDWGWIPYHYGSWAYVWPEGWVWVPGRVWGSSWVCWYEGPDYTYWCPMGPDGNPWFFGASYAFYIDRWAYEGRDDFRHDRYRHHHHHGDDGRGGRGDHGDRGDHKYATANLPDGTNWKKEQPAYQSVKPEQGLAQNPKQAPERAQSASAVQPPSKRIVDSRAQVVSARRLNQVPGRTNEPSAGQGGTRVVPGIQGNNNAAPSRPTTRRGYTIAPNRGVVVSGRYNRVLNISRNPQSKPSSPAPARSIQQQGNDNSGRGGQGYKQSNDGGGVRSSSGGQGYRQQGGDGGGRGGDGHRR